MDYSIHINKYKYGQEIREPLIEKNENVKNIENYSRTTENINRQASIAAEIYDNQILKYRNIGYSSEEEINLTALFKENILLQILVIGTVISFFLIFFLIYIFK